MTGNTDQLIVVALTSLGIPVVCAVRCQRVRSDGWG